MFYFWWDKFNESKLNLGIFAIQSHNFNYKNINKFTFRNFVSHDDINFYIKESASYWTWLCAFTAQFYHQVPTFSIFYIGNNSFLTEIGFLEASNMPKLGVSSGNNK